MSDAPERPVRLRRRARRPGVYLAVAAGSAALTLLALADLLGIL